MSEADRRARIDALFDRALDLDEPAREGFLRSACDDTSMRAEILDLLRLAASPSPILHPDRIVEGPLWRAIAAGAEAMAEPRPGERVGPWRLVRELGRGGMGTVFLAERVEGHFQQRAALKLVHHLGDDSEQMLRRFERERQILASLGHANIARLLDGGCTVDGRPFLAMEYVEGRRIDRYCDEERLDVDGRLALFVCVGRALEHAHRNLVIHRDVKPSNIVVTGEGEVKLLDFGIAKLLSPSEAPGDALTRTVVRVLTPEYASPEQVRGEPVTTASDVYQLGLLLYELLTGTRAQQVQGTSPRALERAVCEASPAAPGSRRAPALSPFRGDLDTIVLHALRKEPARRYASVGEMIEDVERYRRGRPIRARADTWAYRSGRFAARHRAALVGSGVAAAVVVFALASWTGQRSRASREAERAEQMEKLFGDLFLFPNPRQDASASVPSARDYVDRAVALVKRDLGDQPVSRGRLLTQLGRDYVATGAYAPAEEILGQALSIREQHFGAESTEAAETLAWLGTAQHYRGRYPQAEASLRRALRVQEQRLGGDRFAPTSTAIDLGDLLHSRGQLGEAEELLRPVLARVQSRERLAGLLFVCRRTLANVLRDRGALGAAESLYVQAAADAEPRAGHAHLLIMKGDLAGAERGLVAELQRLRRDYRGEHPETAQCLRHLGSLRMEQGRLEEAEASLAEAQAMFARWLETGHPMFARTRAVQAEVARRQGRAQDAVRLARDALDQLERLGLAEHPAALDACHTLGLVRLDLGQPAAEPLGRCLVVARRLYVEGDPRTLALAHAHERALKAE